MSGVLQTPELGPVVSSLVILPRITIKNEMRPLKCLNSASRTGAVMPHGRPVISANDVVLSKLGMPLGAMAKVL